MSRFDINDANDFAALTLGSAGAALQTLNTAFGKRGEWNIQEASYNGVLFHVFSSKSPYQGAIDQITDYGGRRKVKYQFPYRDGQTTDDLGRKPESFTMNILLHGQRYYNGFVKLVTEFNKPTPGELIHPVRGKLKVVPEDFEVTHQSMQRNAVAIRVTFIEHNFTVGDLKLGKDKSVKGALARALELVQGIENAILQVTGAVKFAQSFKNQVTQALEEYKLAFGSTLTSLNRTFNTAESNDIPGLLPVNEGGNFGSTNDRYQVASEVITQDGSVDELAEQIPVLEVNALEREVNTRRAEIASIIRDMEDANNGEGALEFYDSILDLKKSAIALQDVLETGAASSQAQVIEYTVPRLMSIREVAFANGLSVERVNEIDLLNPSLLSTNFISKDTVVKVPVS